MFYEQRLDVPETPAQLRAEYDDALASLLESVGMDTAEAATDVPHDTLRAIATGDSPSLSLPDAAAIVALDPDEPDAETIEIEACEHLLLGMSTAVLDVESLAAELSLDLDPKEVQQKLERRAPMTFAEFVHIQHAIASNAP